MGTETVGSVDRSLENRDGLGVRRYPEETNVREGGYPSTSGLQNVRK